MPSVQKTVKKCATCKYWTGAGQFIMSSFIYCYGKTPMQTFRDTIHLAREKMIRYNSETEV